jgi:hypothetical protein
MFQEKSQQPLQQLMRCTTEWLNRDQACWGQYLQFPMLLRLLHQSLLIAHQLQVYSHIANDSTITAHLRHTQCQAICLLEAHSLLKCGVPVVVVLCPLIIPVVEPVDM